MITHHSKPMELLMAAVDEQRNHQEPISLDMQGLLTLIAAMKANLIAAIKSDPFENDGLIHLMARYQARIAPRERNLLRAGQGRHKEFSRLALPWFHECSETMQARVVRIEYEKLAAKGNHINTNELWSNMATVLNEMNLGRLEIDSVTKQLA